MKELVCHRCNRRSVSGDRFCQACGERLPVGGSLAAKGVVLALALAVALGGLFLYVSSSRKRPDSRLMAMGGARTDSLGEVRVPTIGTVRATDSQGRALAGIQVSVLSGASRWLVVARDLQRRHAPALVHGKLNALATSWTGATWGAPGLAAVVRPATTGGRIPIRLPRVVRRAARELGGPVEALADYLEDPPAMLTDSGTYRVECQTEAQMLASYRLVRSLVLIPLKLTGGSLSAALQQGADTLGYVGITDEHLLRHVIHALYGRHRRYKVGFPTAATVFDEQGSDELVRWSSLRRLDPTDQQQRPVWSVLGACAGEPPPDSRPPPPARRPEAKKQPRRQAAAPPAAPAAVRTPQARWAAVAPLPTPVTTHAVASSGQTVYVIGGTTTPGSPPSPNSSVFHARVSAGGGISTWQRTSSPGGNWHNLDAVAHRGAVYAAGGSNGYGALSRVMVAVINPTDGSLGPWRSARSLPSSQENGALAAHRGHLYLMGGRNAGCYQARVQPGHGLDQWSSCTALPGTSANQHGAAVAGGRMYYFRNEGQPALLVASIQQDGSLGAWRSAPSSFSGPVGVAVSLGSRLVVLGRSSSGSPVAAATCRLGSGGLPDTWRRLPAMPRPRSNHDGVVAGKYLVVVGGTGPGQRGYAGTVQAYSLGPL